MPLFDIKDKRTIQIKPSSFSTERELQRLFEQHLETLLGVRFVASEATTGDRQRGRIDTLGLDQDGSPVIIEYKKATNENIINQGLFYLDWLIDHRGDFTLRVQDTLGKEVKIDWSHPRLILIAESFSEYDKYAVNQIAKNIELWEYQRYGDDFLYIHCFYSVTKPSQPKQEGKLKAREKDGIPSVEIEYSVESHLEGKPEAIVDTFLELREMIHGLDSEGGISEKATKLYIAFRHGKNFCEMWIQQSQIRMWLDIQAENLIDPFNLTRNMKGIGHWGTGDVEVTVTPNSNLGEIIDLISQAYLLTK